MKTVIITVAIYSLFVIAILVGEIRCIVKACQCNWDPVGKAEVIYTVSACTGLGMIVGYINIEDK